MKCLVPKKGHSLKEPCRAKMIAYEFLTDQKFDSIQGMNSDCNHTFKEDTQEEFEKNIFIWTERFKNEIQRQKGLRPRQIDEMVEMNLMKKRARDKAMGK